MIHCGHTRTRQKAGGCVSACIGGEHGLDGGSTAAAYVLISSVMLSPFSRMRPRVLRVFFLMLSSSASSSTRFMYSSKPIMRPSMRNLCSHRATPECAFSATHKVKKGANSQ